MLTMLRCSVMVALGQASVNSDLPADSFQDENTFIQLPSMVLTGKQQKHTPAMQLLVQAKSLAQSVQAAHQDPLRQCQGGWQSGDGTGEGNSERAIGHQQSRESCIAAVRAQCADANGATYLSDPGECFCEIGQQQLDGTVTGKENCVFFDAGKDDVAIATTTDTLADLVTSILDTMQFEHEAAVRLAHTLFDAVTTAREAPSVNNADEVTELGETAERLRGAADLAHQAVEDCEGDLATWTATKNSACSEWEAHFRSLSSCSSACPCTSDSDRFYESYVTWRDILANGGGEEIERLHQNCKNATLEVDHRSGSGGQCAELQAQADAAEAESVLADHDYSSNWHLHNQSCISLGNSVDVFVSTKADLTMELTHRNKERCVLQQVQCYIGLITRASGSGELQTNSDECDSTTCEAFFKIDFPKVPPSPQCVNCPGCVQFGGSGDAEPYDHTVNTQCSIACYNNFPSSDFCNTASSDRCGFWGRQYNHQWETGYWQIITSEPQTFVKFEITANSGTNGYVKYSDNGQDWSNAAQIGEPGTTNYESGDIDVEWERSEVGAHRYWRYQTVTGQPGGWAGNFKFFTAPQYAQVVRDGDKDRAGRQ